MLVGMNTCGWTVVDVGWVWTACGSMALECETKFGGLHETPPVNGMVNERANGSETGTGTENPSMRTGSGSEIGIKNETMTKHTNGSGRMGLA
jgi:hypothetical protein